MLSSVVSHRKLDGKRSTENCAVQADKQEQSRQSGFTLIKLVRYTIPKCSRNTFIIKDIYHALSTQSRQKKKKKESYFSSIWKFCKNTLQYNNHLHCMIMIELRLKID